MIEMTNLSKAIKGNKLCVNYLLTVFYPRNTLTKLKVHKAFILSPGLMYCQVRSCVQMRGENAKTILVCLEALSTKNSHHTGTSQL